MKISHIKISNILGIDELEFSPSGYTEISGTNASGKTSILEAIKSVLKGGHDATLLRKGAEQGEIVLVLDDNTEIKRRVSESDSVTEVRRDGKKISRPAETLKALADLMSVNPVDFLLAPKKDRVRVLLESMPIEVDADRLADISGVDVDHTPGVHALHVIDQVYKEVYDARTGTNRAVREKKATISQLEQAVPQVPEGAEGDEQELEEKIQEIEQAKSAEMDRIAKKLDAIRQETADKIAEIQRKAQEAIDEQKAHLAEMERRAAAQREKSLQKFAEQREPVAAQLNTLRSNRDLAARRAQTLETIGIMKTELDALTEEAKSQTQALADIEAYKAELISSLPIPGLEVRDGEIYRDGVAFDRLNTAQQVSIAVEIAKLRAGKLGVVCVDGLELLDAKNYEAFKTRAIESGLQLFVTRVNDGEFSIETEETSDQ